MPDSPEKDKRFSRLDAINKRLYSKDQKALRGHREGILHPTNYQVENAWGNIKEKTPLVKRIKLPPSIFKRFFIFASIFFTLALAYALYSFFAGGNTVSNQNIDIAILGNTFTAGGEDLPLQVEVTNRNTVSLELADLIVTYPKGQAGEGDNNNSVLRYTLGSVAPGKVTTKDLSFTLFGEEGSTKDITFALEYRLAGSNAIFEKDKVYTVTLNSAPIALSVDAPKEINSNQKFTMNIKTTVNAKKTVEGILLKADYPPGFKFESADPAPTSFDNVWNLGDLAPGTDRTIKISGTILGEDGEERTFHIYTGGAKVGDSTNIGTVYNSYSHIVTIVKPFIEARILVNGSDQDDTVVSAERTVSAQIVWANNLPTRITDAQISVSLAGNALSEPSIKTNSGFYDSTKNTIIWDKTSDSTLASIEPGEHGAVDFSFESIPLIGDSGSPLKDPVITLSVSIKGKEPSLGASVDEITNATTKTIKIGTDFQIAAQAVYSTGPFGNTGPMPPKAENPTTYTITWTVANSANTVTGAEARATLPTYVSWVGASVPATESISYDDSSRTIVWKIGTVGSGIGYSSGTRSVSFQVKLSPSLSQVGSVPQLMLDTTATGVDSYTSQTLNATYGAINTRISNDPIYVPGIERVTN